jgi:molybdopterin synthase catalytic subunit
MSMVVHVRLFAALRERAGRDAIDLELPDGALVSDALAAVDDLARDLPLVLAVNREYASRGDALSPGDELALIPPVRDPRAGGVVTFSGVTREVDHLDYEAYAEMAAEQIEAIVAAAIERHGLCRAAAEHRVGRVARSEASVIVAASAPHRAEAFAGAREIIDEIKRRAPIWKREEGEWVRGHAPPTKDG